jgi:predicted nucleotidyltransferase
VSTPNDCERGMIDLSTSTDPDLNAAAQVLAVLDASAKAVGAEYMVVGATARNILSVALLDRPPGRATRDVDIAVAVADWPTFERLTRGLTPRGATHAFTVQAVGTAVDVDVVPYGGVEGPDRSVLFPDDHKLNVLGVREAFDTAQTVRLPGRLDVRVPTVPGPAVLKILAWADRRLQSSRDAVDLDEIIGWYGEGAFLDDLYDDAALLGRYDFDVELTAAHRLGIHIRHMAGSQACEGLLAILNNAGMRARLVNDMGGTDTQNPRRVDAMADGIRGT